MYRRAFAGAVADLTQRDPEDAHAVALARTLLPLCSDDRDLQELGVVCYPTARLLWLLEQQRPPRQ